MSIVYEYLKQIRQQKDPEQPLLAVKPVPQPLQTKSKNKFWVFVIFAFVLLGLVGVAGAVVFMGSFQKKVAPAPVVAEVPKPLEVPAAPVVPRTEPERSGYVLEGISYDPDHPFAIINGKMLERDGRIDDFVVTVITPDSVSLKNVKDESETTLQL